MQNKNTNQIGLQTSEFETDLIFFVFYKVNSIRFN